MAKSKDDEASGMSYQSPEETALGYLEIRPDPVLLPMVLEQAYRETDARDRIKHLSPSPEKLAEYKAWSDAVGTLPGWREGPPLRPRIWKRHKAVSPFEDE